MFFITLAAMSSAVDLVPAPLVFTGSGLIAFNFCVAVAVLFGVAGLGLACCLGAFFFLAPSCINAW